MRYNMGLLSLFADQCLGAVVVHAIYEHLGAGVLLAQADDHAHVDKQMDEQNAGHAVAIDASEWRSLSLGHVDEAL